MDRPTEIGHLVWGRVRGFPKWPGQIMDPRFANAAVLKSKRNPEDILVSFFGDASFAWIEPSEVTDFAAHLSALREPAPNCPVSKVKIFKKAVAEAVVVMQRRAGENPDTEYDPVDFLNQESWTDEMVELAGHMKYPETATPADVRNCTAATALQYLKSIATNPAAIPQMPVETRTSAARLTYGLTKRLAVLTKERSERMESKKSKTLLQTKDLASEPLHVKKAKVKTDAEKTKTDPQPTRKRRLVSDEGGVEEKKTAKRALGAKLPKQTSCKHKASKVKSEAESDDAGALSAAEALTALADNPALKAESAPSATARVPAAPTKAGSESTERTASLQPEGASAPAALKAPVFRVNPEDKEQTLKAYGGSLKHVVLGDIRKLVRKVASQPIDFVNKPHGLGPIAAAALRYREAVFCRSNLLRNGSIGEQTQVALEKCGAYTRKGRDGDEGDGEEDITAGPPAEPSRKMSKKKKEEKIALAKLTAVRAKQAKRLAADSNEEEEDDDSGVEDEQEELEDEEEEDVPVAPQPKRRKMDAPVVYPRKEVVQVDVEVKDYVDRIGTQSQFESNLQRWYGENGKTVQLPIVYSHTWDMYAVFKLVAEQGGYDACTQQRAWKSVACTWLPDLATRNTDVGTLVKQHYNRTLLKFEKHFTANCPKRTIKIEQKKTVYAPAAAAYARGDAASGSDSEDGVRASKGGRKTKVHDPLSQRTYGNPKGNPDWLKDFDDLLDDDRDKRSGAVKAKAGVAAAGLKRPLGAKKPAMIDLGKRPPRPAAGTATEGEAGKAAGKFGNLPDSRSVIRNQLAKRHPEEGGGDMVMPEVVDESRRRVFFKFPEDCQLPSKAQVLASVKRFCTSLTEDDVSTNHIKRNVIVTFPTRRQAESAFSYIENNTQRHFQTQAKVNLVKATSPPSRIQSSHRPPAAPMARARQPTSSAGSVSFDAWASQEQWQPEPSQQLPLDPRRPVQQPADPRQRPVAQPAGPSYAPGPSPISQQPGQQMFHSMPMAAGPTGTHTVLVPIAGQPNVYQQIQVAMPAQNMGMNQPGPQMMMQQMGGMSTGPQVVMLPGGAQHVVMSGGMPGQQVIVQHPHMQPGIMGPPMQQAMMQGQVPTTIHHPPPPPPPKRPNPQQQQLQQPGGPMQGPSPSAPPASTAAVPNVFGLLQSGSLDLSSLLSGVLPPTQQQQPGQPVSSGPVGQPASTVTTLPGQQPGPAGPEDGGSAPQQEPGLQNQLLTLLNMLAPPGAS